MALPDMIFLLLRLMFVTLFYDFSFNNCMNPKDSITMRLNGIQVELGLEKTGLLPMRKQRRRSASQLLRS